MPRVLKPFEYLEPKTVEETVQILFQYGTKAKLLAGGVDLVPRIRQRKIQPEYVVSFQNVPGLDYIKRDGAKGLKIGALTSLLSIELHPAIQKDYMVLYDAIHHIASIQVKTMGTGVGNLCVATPASDVAAALFVLGARLRIISPTDEKIIPIEHFYIGVNQTILQPSEVVTEVLLPRPVAGTGGAFLKTVRTATDIAKVNVAVSLTVSNNTCKEARIALGSVAPTTIRASKAEEILTGQTLSSDIIHTAAEVASREAKPITDIRSTVEYRQVTTQILVRRAILRALERLKM